MSRDDLDELGKKMELGEASMAKNCKIHMFDVVKIVP